MNVNSAGNTFFNGGNVGIGTTGPTGKLSVQGNGSSYSLFVSTDANGGSGNLVVNTLGNVGIGTTSPGSNLQINGSEIRLVDANASDVPQFSFYEGGTLRGAVQYRNSGASAPANTMRIGSANAGGQTALMSGNAIEAVRLDASGNVGIGTTTPAGLFTVGNGTMVVTAAGRVGIGTTSPDAKLDVVGRIYAKASNLEYGFISWDGTDPPNASYLYAGPRATGWNLIGSSANGTGVLRGIGFTIGGTDSVGDVKMAINTSGNVGIGTTAPGATLEVAGQVKITGGVPGAGKVLTSDAAGLASWQTPAAGSVPSGLIALFAGACPAGWTEYTFAQGRLIAGVPSLGTVAGTVGTALANLAAVDPGHGHAFTPAGSVSAPTFTGSAGTTGATAPSFTGSAGTTGGPSATVGYGNYGTYGGCTNPLGSSSCAGTLAVGGHTHSFTPSGTVGSHTHAFTPAGTISAPSFTGSAGTTGTTAINVPYIQLRLCQAP